MREIPHGANSAHSPASGSPTAESGDCSPRACRVQGTAGFALPASLSGREGGTGSPVFDQSPRQRSTCGGQFVLDGKRDAQGAVCLGQKKGAIGVPPKNLARADRLTAPVRILPHVSQPTPTNHGKDVLPWL